MKIFMVKQKDVQIQIAEHRRQRGQRVARGGYGSLPDALRRTQGDHRGERRMHHRLLPAAAGRSFDRLRDHGLGLRQTRRPGYRYGRAHPAGRKICHKRRKTVRGERRARRRRPDAVLLRRSGGGAGRVTGGRGIARTLCGSAGRSHRSPHPRPFHARLQAQRGEGPRGGDPGKAGGSRSQDLAIELYYYFQFW